MVISACHNNSSVTFFASEKSLVKPRLCDGTPKETQIKAFPVFNYVFTNPQRFILPGLLTSITLPCYDKGGNFIGVVGTDISMADLLSDVTYFQKGQSSYAWMADSSGRTMMHPLLPAPSNAFVDPIFMDITALEAEPGFDTVLQSIKV